MSESLKTEFERHLTRMPKRVKIGACVYSIERAPAAHPLLAGDDGACDFDTERIVIHEVLLLSQATNTLIHECNHGVNHAYGLTDSSCEEDFANQGANGWMALRVDNPKLDAWLNRAVRLIRKVPRK